VITFQGKNPEKTVTKKDTKQGPRKQIPPTSRTKTSVPLKPGKEKKKSEYILENTLRPGTQPEKSSSAEENTLTKGKHRIHQDKKKTKPQGTSRERRSRALQKQLGKRERAGSSAYQNNPTAYIDKKAPQ